MYEDPDAGTFTILDKERGCLVTYDIFTGDEVDAGDTKLPTLAAYPYTVDMAQAICTMIREGMTMKEISRMEGMPRIGQIYGWMNRYPDFKHNVKQARLDRAHTFHDRIVDKLGDLEKTSDEDLTSLGLSKERLVIDTLKWATEKNNPDEYGSRTKISGDRDNPIGIQVIDTGIRRNTIPEKVEEEAIEAESCVVEDES